MYGIALTNPIIQLLEAQAPSFATGPQDGGVSEMPKATGKDKLAPLEPVYRTAVISKQG